MIVDSVLGLIGNTPMVKLNHLNQNASVEMYVKLEKNNPGGSVKDRIAKYMIEHAENEGSLTEDKTVIEATSGNTGIGLAIVCAVKGYKLVLVMPETMTKERRKILIALGAKIVLSDGSKGMDGAEDLVKKIVDENPDKFFTPNQFANRFNTLAHYETTGKEILRDTKGRITHFVAGIGTSGTLMGVSKRLKEHDPKIRIIAVEPHPKTAIQGLKNLQTQYVPKIWNASRIDEKETVTLEEAEETTRLLALREGIFCGPSSGAILSVALKKAKEINNGVMVIMLPDGGEKYLSTELCDLDKCLACIQKHGISCAYFDEEIKAALTRAPV